jgi:uncharacterized protein YceK
MKQSLSAVLFCLSVVAAGGCGTIKNLADTGGTVYGGARRNVEDMDKLRDDRPCIEQGFLLPNLNADPCIAPLYPIDLLLCITADTILLPYTGIRSLIRKHRNTDTSGDESENK